MAPTTHTRKMPREQVDTSHMRPDEQIEHIKKTGRANAMSIGGIPPKTTIKSRY